MLRDNDVIDTYGIALAACVVQPAELIMFDSLFLWYITRAYGRHGLPKYTLPSRLSPGKDIT